MIKPPACYDRECIYFIGIVQKGGTEESERPVCAAFYDGIPDDIAYGDNKHLTSVDGDNGIVYKKE